MSRHKVGNAGSRHEVVGTNPALTKSTNFEAKSQTKNPLPAESFNNNPILVPMAGFEPARSYDHGALNSLPRTSLRLGAGAACPVLSGGQDRN